MEGTGERAAAWEGRRSRARGREERGKQTAGKGTDLNVEIKIPLKLEVKSEEMEKIREGVTQDAPLLPSALTPAHHTHTHHIQLRQ